MDTPIDQPKSPRLRLLATAVAVAAIAVAGTWFVNTRSSSGEQLDDVEVCQTTEYEGCPQRWEYLWADEED